MGQSTRETMCQCVKCGHVFSSTQKQHSDIYPFGACPVCGGNYHILRFENSDDEYYVDRIGNRITY